MTAPADRTRIPAPDLRPLTSTYRVQLNKTFTLNDSRVIVPYLDRLGISHLYCSPILKARRGSMHGYDVVDPAQVNPEIGSVDDLRALARELHERGMGMLVDIVPNHMGLGPANPYWEDVLAHGPQSRYAAWFDIDWDAAKRKVVLPVLADELEALLARGDITLDLREKHPRICCGESSWPVDPATLSNELQVAHLDPTAVSDSKVLLSGEEGQRRLRELLDAQHYRLVFWRRGPKEINYRRFFDISDLIGVRQEDPEVFSETHAFILSLVAEGTIDGLRIDHIDGLKDPLGYLERLRQRLASRPIPIFVEKILSPEERLRESWPVQGTTGYEFLNDLEDLFLDEAGFRQVERVYRTARRLTSGTFADVARDGKARILTGALRADVSRLARLLFAALASAPKPETPRPESTRADVQLATLERAIVEFIAALPVYRTYVDGRGTVDQDDIAVVERALADLRRRVSDPSVVALAERLAAIVLGREDSDAGTAAAPRLDFVTRLQQTSGPATAKGVEDTALYVYVPLVSRNEVGGAPDRPLDDAVGRFHRGNTQRAAKWPLSLTCTNTHDTKRSADVRARLDVLTECADEWKRHVTRWRRLNHRHRSVVKGRLIPDTNSEYLLYQTLVGIWPPPSPLAEQRVDDLPDRAWLQSARPRLEEYMLKAVKEAKTRTSWTDPDTEYERALTQFIERILDLADDALFLADVARFVARIAPAGHWNAIARLVMHLTAPGTPDTYRGDELWFFALVDPDNRRPVDYAERVKLLDTLCPSASASPSPSSCSPLASLSPTDPRLKLGILMRLLHNRRADPELFRDGSYTPLEVRGERAPHLIAFLRSRADRHVIVLAPRLNKSIHSSGVAVPQWGDTYVVMPNELRGVPLRSSLVDNEVVLVDAAQRLSASAALAHLPVAVLLSS